MSIKNVISATLIDRRNIRALLFCFANAVNILNIQFDEVFEINGAKWFLICFPKFAGSIKIHLSFVSESGISQNVFINYHVASSEYRYNNKKRQAPEAICFYST